MCVKVVVSKVVLLQTLDTKIPEDLETCKKITRALDMFPLLIQGHNSVLVKRVSRISDLDGLGNSSTILKASKP